MRKESATSNYQVAELPITWKQFFSIWPIFMSILTIGTMIFAVLLKQEKLDSNQQRMNEKFDTYVLATQSVLSDHESRIRSDHEIVSKLDLAFFTKKK